MSWGVKPWKPMRWNGRWVIAKHEFENASWARTYYLKDSWWVFFESETEAQAKADELNRALAA